MNNQQDQLYLSYLVHIGELPGFRNRRPVGTVDEADQMVRSRLAKANLHIQFSGFFVYRGTKRQVLKVYPRQDINGNELPQLQLKPLDRL